MVDADDPAIGRVDTATDPTALTESEIRAQLQDNPNLTGKAVREFADQIASRREGVAEEARSLLRNRISKNPANPSVIQVRKADGTLGPKIPDSGAGSVDLSLSDSGEVSARIKGETVDLGRVDLDKGADSPRSERYSDRRHPAQQRGGGR